MRFLLLITALAASTPAWAEETPHARAAFVERRGLAEADSRCDLFDLDVRAALLAGVGQARGALLRSGWSSGQVRELEAVVIEVAHGRECTDPRTQTAAASARRAFASWATAGSMQFPGWTRAWSASRTPGVNGWALGQVIDAPIVAHFGIRTHNGAQQLALVLALPRGLGAPAARP
jgi:hypothetical protein